jgi:hypothetical protein
VDKSSTKEAAMAPATSSPNTVEAVQPVSNSLKVNDTNGKSHHEDTTVETHSESHNQTITTGKWGNQVKGPGGDGES